jgi:hypothetical protein
MKTIQIADGFEDPTGRWLGANRRLLVAALCVGALALAGCGGGLNLGLGNTTSFCTDWDTFLNADKAAHCVGACTPVSRPELQKMFKQAQQLRGEAPATIKADVTTIADGAKAASNTGSGFFEATVDHAVGRTVDYARAHCDDLGNFHS